MNTAIRKGNNFLRIAIVGAAWAAVRMKNSYWNALFDKLRKRTKAQKAIVAVASRLFKVVYKTLERCRLSGKRHCTLCRLAGKSRIVLSIKIGVAKYKHRLNELKRTEKVIEITF